MRTSWDIARSIRWDRPSRQTDQVYCNQNREGEFKEDSYRGWIYAATLLVFRVLVTRRYAGRGVSLSSAVSFPVHFRACMIFPRSNQSPAFFLFFPPFDDCGTPSPTGAKRFLNAFNISPNQYTFNALKSVFPTRYTISKLVGKLVLQSGEAAPVGADRGSEVRHSSPCDAFHADQASSDKFMV